jgi:hypothetical protein
MNLAPGAEPILSMRMSGQRPASDVVISTVGQMPVDFLIEADLDTDYDWAFLIDLNVWVVASTKAPAAKLRALLWAFRKHRPKNLYLWLDDQQKGYQLFFLPKLESISRPIEQWQWEMEKQSLLKFQNKAMQQVFAGEVA